MDLDLQGVHVLVTGASGGIGLEAARLFITQGAKVTAHYNSNAAPLQALVADLGGDSIQISRANLSVEEDVANLFSTATSGSFGPVQVAVINHAIYETADVPLKDMDLDQWNRTINTNLTSSFLVAREYLRHLEQASDEAKAKASILFVGSTAGKFGEMNHADYSASKSAMMYGLTLSLKNEIVKIAPKARVNSIAPGWVKTPMAENALKDPTVLYRAIATTPLKKVAIPYDVVAQIVFISSPKTSGHVNGQVIMVHGGMEGRLLNLPEDL